MEIQPSFRCIAFADDLLPMCKKTRGYATLDTSSLPSYFVSLIA